jgi:hypothetical protein
MIHYVIAGPSYHSNDSLRDSRAPGKGLRNLADIQISVATLPGPIPRGLNY